MAAMTCFSLHAVRDVILQSQQQPAWNEIVAQWERVSISVRL